MTGSSLALDTNAAIAVLSGDQSVASAVGQFESVSIPVPVVGELRYGAINSGRPTENLSTIERLTAHCTVLAADERTAVVYAEIRSALKERGRPIPENDVWIAAICIQHDHALATRDAHFAEVEGLRTIAI